MAWAVALGVAGHGPVTLQGVVIGGLQGLVAVLHGAQDVAAGYARGDLPRGLEQLLPLGLVEVAELGRVGLGSQRIVLLLGRLASRVVGVGRQGCQLGVGGGQPAAQAVLIRILMGHKGLLTG
jgi:hypothetical protein